MKPFAKGIFLFLLICTCWPQSASAASVNVVLNGKPLSFDASPYIENDRVLVPVRGVLESLGYSIHWQEESRTVLAAKDDLEISLPLNSQTITVNNEPVIIDVPATLKNDRTFVPLRFLAEYSGAEVQWDAGSSTVVIFSSTAESYQMADSVVYIQTNKRQGSGVVLTSNGLIVTNYHIIRDVSTAQFVFNDGRIYQGETTVVGIDPQNDIALLKIEAADLTPAFIAAEYHVGDPVTAIGSPNGVRNAVTTGVISGFDSNVISATAAITNGNSGGGLFDASNKLIGITSFFTSEQYFSIPISLVQQVPPSMPFPLEEMVHYSYTPEAPETLSLVKNDPYTYIYWSPVYHAEHYYVYTAKTENGTYTRLKNPVLNSEKWYWGFPQCFGIAVHPENFHYIKVSAVVDGVESPLSAPLYLSE